MQIHELNGVTLTSNASVAVDTGSDTGKSTIDTLAGYILETNLRTVYDNSRRTIVGALNKAKSDITALSNTVTSLTNAFYYHNNDTEAFGSFTPNVRILESGFITGSGTLVYFDIITPKMTTLVTSVRATTLYGRLRGVQGPLADNIDINFGDSGYSITAAIAGVNRVAITIRADTALSNYVNNTPISFHGQIVLEFTA